MIVQLRRVTKTPLDFEIHSNEIIFKGYLEYHKAKLTLLRANINGLLEKSCDICAEEFSLVLNEKIEFFINDGVFEDDNNIDLDVVESLDGNANMLELLNSEIELIRSDYHSCESCKKINR